MNEKAIVAWLEQMTQQPRAMQLLAKDSSLINTLEETMNRHLKDVKKMHIKADKRFVAYKPR